MSDPPKVLLLDGTGVAYRAYHAIPELSTSDGKPTNALYGFIRMWHQWERQVQPTHAAVVFDGGLPESRLSALAEYKAQRPRMPENLRAQLPWIEQFLHASGVKSLRVEGEEADDVIATVVTKLCKHPCDVLVVSSDKDLFQIVSDSVRIMSPTTKEVLDVKGIVAKTGVKPCQIPDWLALVGDSADNIPGVPGVGEKTAARLLAEYGTLSFLRKNLATLPNEKLRHVLAEHWDVVERNRQIVQLKQDVPLPFDQLDALILGRPDYQALLSLYREMEFHSLADNLTKSLSNNSQLGLGI